MKRKYIKGKYADHRYIDQLAHEFLSTTRVAIKIFNQRQGNLQNHPTHRATDSVDTFFFPPDKYQHAVVISIQRVKI